MAKTKFFIDLSKPIPEWGLSEAISTAVPIAVSGVEIKSTRHISSGMQMSILNKIDAKTLKEARNSVATANKRDMMFTTRVRAGSLTRKVK